MSFIEVKFKEFIKMIENYVHDRLKELQQRKQEIADELSMIDVREEELNYIIKRIGNESVDVPEAKSVESLQPESSAVAEEPIVEPVSEEVVQAPEKIEPSVPEATVAPEVKVETEATLEADVASDESSAEISSEELEMLQADTETKVA
jgi:hypothetical protein